MGYTVYEALYYKLHDNDEERDICKELQDLVEQMLDTDTIPMRNESDPTNNEDDDSTNQYNNLSTRGRDSSTLLQSKPPLSHYELDQDLRNSKQANSQVSSPHQLNVHQVDQGESTDEGIGEDVSGASHSGADFEGSQCHNISIDAIIRACVLHSKANDAIAADSYYRSVLRGLVNEAAQANLKKLGIDCKPLQECHEDDDVVRYFDIQGWSRKWMQVMGEFKGGIALRRVDKAALDPQNNSKKYELTPYEKFLEDIRTRRYRLRETGMMVNGDIPLKIKKDAHDLVLDYIRSRPRLRPVSQRSLPPSPPEKLTPRERLMESLRQPHKLRPTPGRRALSAERRLGDRSRATNGSSVPREKMTAEHSMMNGISAKETSRTTLADPHVPSCQDMTATPGRRLIKPDLSLRLSSSFDEDDDTTEMSSDPTTARRIKDASSLQDFSMADDDDDLLQITLDEDYGNDNIATRGDEGQPSRPTSFQRTSNRRFSFKKSEYLLIFVEPQCEIRSLLTYNVRKCSYYFLHS